MAGQTSDVFELRFQRRQSLIIQSQTAQKYDQKTLSESGRDGAMAAAVSRQGSESALRL
jgi:hypothetical protein